MLEIQILVQDIRERGYGVIRSLHATESIQQWVTKAVVDALGDGGEYQYRKYIENHADWVQNLENLMGERKSDFDISIPWHLEHLGWSGRASLASWNMQIFNCKSTEGRTGFVDAAQLYDDMPAHYQNFLEMCSVRFNLSKLNIKSYTADGLAHPAVRISTACGRKCISLSPVLDGEELYKVGNEHPSNEDKELFSEIKFWVMRNVWSEPSRQDWHLWTSGDLLVVDLERMYHAVSGGFTPAQREFVGYWACPQEPF